MHFVKGKNLLSKMKDELRELPEKIMKKHNLTTVLPDWLDRKLFDEMGAFYAQNHKEAEYNLELDERGVKRYLGTYFPRSYAEAFCIFDDILKNNDYLATLENLEEIRILDFGCGTGGELIGLLVVLNKYLKNPKKVKIIAIDGCKNALNSLDKILKETTIYCKKIHLEKSLMEFSLKTENDFDNIEISGTKYHFILNGKMVNELISKKIILQPYLQLSYLFTHILAENGLFYFLDVAIKNEELGLFYSQIMNKELNHFMNKMIDFSTLLPLCCGYYKCSNRNCYTRQVISVSHSHKKDDKSNVCYRIICRKTFKDLIVKDNEYIKNNKHQINSKLDLDEGLCIHSLGGKKVIDSFKLRS